MALSRYEIYQKLSEMLEDTEIVDEDLYAIVDFILDNFEAKGM